MNKLMKKSSILKKAKAHLSTGTHAPLQSNYICLALLIFQSRHPRQHRRVHELVSWISEQLNGKGTYMVWLKINHPKICRSITTHVEVQQARHQWLDHMIKVCEEMGD